jgi:multidrug efflux pump subunit AcrB
VNRLIQWFVENPIGANLLMAMILIGGLFNLAELDKEVFPGVSTDRIQISVPYPGAGPLEVEEQIVERIEEAIGDLDGIEEITSKAKLSNAQITVEVSNGFDTQRLLNNIKTRVDAIPTLPEDAERPQVTELLWRSEVMSIGLYGDVEESALKETGEQLRDQLALLPGISIVELNATRADEMAIEVSEKTLRHYNLSFEQVVQAVRQSSLNLPAGTIKSNRGDIQLQTRGQAYSAADFESIVIDSREDGATLHLGDIATITDGFTEQDLIARLNGKPAVYLELYITDNPDILNASKTVHEFLETAQSQLPPGIEVTVWRDWSHLFEGRMNLLLENSINGLILVFIVLMLFLRPALALWVCVGIAIAFMGALWLLPYAGVSLNMISMFAFLLVLGIVVDDAIIVGESIYSRQQHGLKGAAAAASGSKLVSKPVSFAIISTMIFFMPILGVPGPMGDMSYGIPVVVILALFFSWIESLLILPSHLSHIKPERADSRFAVLRKMELLREKFSATMLHFSDRVYQPYLTRVLNRKATSISVFVVVFGLSVAIFNGGWLTRTFMPIVPSDFIRTTVTLPEGSPFSLTQSVLEKVESAVVSLEKDGELSEINQGQPFIENMQSWAYDNKVTVALGLTKGEERDVSAQDISKHWRLQVGDLPEAEEIDANYTINSRSKPISLRLSIAADDQKELTRAVEQVKTKLSQYPGIYDVKDSHTAARTEIELDLKSHAEMLGLGLVDIARQVRQGFYGEEAQRIPRGKEDVKVMVRYPEDERGNISQLSDMRIRTQDQREIPLDAVADIDFVPGYTSIDRIDRKRSISLTAEVSPGTSDPAMVVSDLMSRNIQQWRSEFPGFNLSIDGDMSDESDFMTSALQNFVLALIAIYGLMAVAFRSYWQPFLILTAIPFGFMGAVIGHVLMGREVSMMSMLGFFACAGVVVNDNLVLLDRINQLRKEGHEAVAAVIQAGRDRFRPIILTSLTTFIGLMPIMAETSTQARFLIPMVISLSFGVLFATTVTLILVPALYVSGENLRTRITQYMGRKPATEDSASDL